MEYLLSIMVGFLFSAGIYLMLKGELVRIIIGLLLLSNSVNLTIFTMGRIHRGKPPLIPGNEKMLVESFANPLPQALILTAIVIGFGLLGFTIVLALKAYREFDSVNINRMRTAEPLYPDEEQQEE